jgi:2-polyprenyl-3-methyl-5-hydroxy-6-metoxy-1,4-benzoquinol methylase
MQKEYWNRVNYDAEIFDVRKNDKKGIIESSLSELAAPGKVVADIGCAVGKWLPFLSPRFKKVYAIDFIEKYLAYAESRYSSLGNVTFMNVDMTLPEKIPFTFDVVLCVNAVIISSAAKRSVFFKKLFDCIKKGGHLVMVVPSFESSVYSDFILNRINLNKGIIQKPKKGKEDSLVLEHLRQGVVRIDNQPTKHYIREELITIIQALGFRIEKIDKVEYGWKTEVVDPPASLKGPYPWDWMLVAKKVK